MKLGLYGGSFDPIHNGHLVPVREAKEGLGLDRVLYLPTANPPHKRERRLAPSLARFAMVELALLSQEGMFASAVEMTGQASPGPVNYTVETLEYFRRQEPEKELYLLLGSDSFQRFHTWHRWREIPQLARLVILQRPGSLDYARHLSEDLADLLKSDRVEKFTNRETVDISSSEIRRSIASGNAAPRAFIPSLVLNYLDKYGLYRL